MRYVIADACKGMNESFHLVEHAIDDHRKLGEGIVRVSMREPFTQVAADNALNSLIDLVDAFPGTTFQRDTDRKAKEHIGNKAKCERPANAACHLRDFVDVSSKHQLS